MIDAKAEIANGLIIIAVVNNKFKTLKKSELKLPVITLYFGIAKNKIKIDKSFSGPGALHPISATFRLMRLFNLPTDFIEYRTIFWRHE